MDPDSRSASIRLAALFSLLAGSAAVAAAALSWIAARLLSGADAPAPILVSAGTGAIVLLLICAGAWNGWRSTRNGAQSIVHRLGALSLTEDDPVHGDLRRVAEETAIAAGIPAPMLYILPVPQINALTLGGSPSSAVLLVTRGALEQLGMEELRGLVAHELAHVFRGDNAADTRLAGLLHGFLGPRLLQHRLRQWFDGWPSAPAGAAAVPEIGALPHEAGSCHGRRSPVRRLAQFAVLPPYLLLTLVARAGMPWVRLAWLFVPTRREVAADALAVRFTGDREGLGRVLRRIAGEAQIALPGGPAAAIEHFLFVPSRLRCSAVRIDAHLAYRIRRLYGRSMPRIGAAGPAAPDRRQCAASANPALARALPATGQSERLQAGNGRSGPGANEDHDGEVAFSAPTAGATAEPEAGPDCSVLAYRETVPGAPEYQMSGDGLSWFSFQLAADLGSTDVRAARLLEVLVGCSRGPCFDDERAGRWLGLLASGVAETPAGPDAGAITAPGSPSGAGGGSRSCEAGSLLDSPDAALGWILSSEGALWRMPLFELLLARTRGWSHARRRVLLEQCRRAVSQRARDNPLAWVYYTLAQHRLSLASPECARARRRLVSRFDQSRALATLFAMASILAEASARNTRDALADAAVLLTISPPAATPERVSAIELVRSLEILSMLPVFSKPILLKVLGRLARSQHEPDYQAFLRTVAAAIDCPAPRLGGRRRAAKPCRTSGGDDQDDVQNIRSGRTVEIHGT